MRATARASARRPVLATGAGAGLGRQRLDRPRGLLRRGGGPLARHGRGVGGLRRGARRGLRCRRSMCGRRRVNRAGRGIRWCARPHDRARPSNRARRSGCRNRHRRARTVRDGRSRAAVRKPGAAHTCRAPCRPRLPSPASGRASTVTAAAAVVVARAAPRRTARCAPAGRPARGPSPRTISAASCADDRADRHTAGAAARIARTPAPRPDNSPANASPTSLMANLQRGAHQRAHTRRPVAASSMNQAELGRGCGVTWRAPMARNLSTSLCVVWNDVTSRTRMRSAPTSAGARPRVIHRARGFQPLVGVERDRREYFVRLDRPHRLAAGCRQTGRERVRHVVGVARRASARDRPPDTPRSAPR